MGAALAVLRGGRVPLVLSAAKSRLGHAEPAAGAIGMLQVRAAVSHLPRQQRGTIIAEAPRKAITQCNVAEDPTIVVLETLCDAQATAMLGQAMGRALMHLRSVNSHVSSLLSSKTQVCTSSGSNPTSPPSVVHLKTVTVKSRQMSRLLSLAAG